MQKYLKNIQNRSQIRPKFIQNRPLEGLGGDLQHQTSPDTSFVTIFCRFGVNTKLKVGCNFNWFSTFLIFHDITTVFSSKNNWSTAVDQLFLEILHQIPPKYSICARDTLPHTFLSTCVLDLKVYQFWTESEPASPMRAWLLFLCCILHFVSMVRARLSQRLYEI